MRVSLHRCMMMRTGAIFYTFHVKFLCLFLGDDSIKHMKDQRIRLCRISPLNTKEYLDIRFADFEELFRLEAS